MWRVLSSHAIFIRRSPPGSLRDKTSLTTWTRPRFLMRAVINTACVYNAHHMDSLRLPESLWNVGNELPIDTADRPIRLHSIISFEIKVSIWRGSVSFHLHSIGWEKFLNNPIFRVLAAMTIYEDYRLLGCGVVWCSRKYRQFIKNYTCKKKNMFIKDVRKIAQLQAAAFLLVPLRRSWLHHQRMEILVTPYTTPSTIICCEPNL
jgi:hypothetical protein